MRCWIVAVVAADTVALDTLLAPECTYTHSTGLFQTYQSTSIPAEGEKP